jgi:hypothetical protein
VTAYPRSIIKQAERLRKSGHSFGDISQKLKISKSTASAWLNLITLDKSALNILNNKRLEARNRGLATIRKNRTQLLELIESKAKNTLENIDLNNPFISKLLCSLLYWGEGNKTGSRIGFINSDPLMISTFLKLLRRSFTLDESKFRALVHIHEYHNEREIKSFWSNITLIPLTQFTKSYLKPHTKTVIRSGYKGALRISYGDYKIALELKLTYNSLGKYLGAW